MDINVIVADDHTLFRAGLTRMLGSFDGVRIAAEAANAGEVLALVGTTSADLLMLDLSMPGASGVSLIEEVRRATPALPILVLSMHDEPALVKKALKAGAAGYITKDVTPDVLAAAIARIAGGGRYVAPSIGESLAFDFEADDAPARQLTAREVEILRLIAEQGLSLVQIAEQLGLSPKTVTAHKANIMAKLGVANNLELIRYVVDQRPFD
ncbi:MAG: response regulator transcription factor [Rhodocyclales bacterium]|nr:response regulator transcription factor [Rhodocyclales bacterium]